MKIKLLISAVILIIMSLVFAPEIKAQTATYYLGDAIIYNGQTIIGSTNMSGDLELLKLSGKNIIRAARIDWVKNTDSKSETFYGFTFSAEQEKLYAYLVDGRYLFKYDISDLSAPVLIYKIRDNSWDYFMGVKRVDNSIITFGVKGIKVWSLDKQIIDGYNLINQTAYNINFSTDNLIVSADKGNLKIFDKLSRQLINQVPFLTNEDNNRKTFIDTVTKEIYLVDDGSLKKFNYGGQPENIFKHISNRGYDVDGLIGKNHLYFTDGKGIVKFNKSDLKPIKWTYTTSLGKGNGWAMGLKVLADGNGEKIIIFNNSGILILDENLKKISYFTVAL